MADIPLSQQIAELQRELQLRQRVYPGLVRQGKMRQAEAALHLDRMAAALRTLEGLRHREALELRLGGRR